MWNPVRYSLTLILCTLAIYIYAVLQDAHADTIQQIGIAPAETHTAGLAWTRINEKKKSEFYMSAGKPMGDDSVPNALGPVSGTSHINSLQKRSGLVPTGNEWDFTMGYRTPISEHMSLNMTVSERRDSDNPELDNETRIKVGTKIRF